MDGPGHYFLKTANLGFRWWSQDDLPLALALWGNPQVTRLIGGPFSEVRVAEKLRQEIARGESHGIQYWPIFLLTTGEFVGCAGLRPYKPEQGIPELGFHLLPAFWGKRLAEEAARGVILCAFSTIGAKAVFAGHHPQNLASRHILQKLGFKYAGERFYETTGLMHPGYLLAPS